jgi:hypothetical protein
MNHAMHHRRGMLLLLVLSILTLFLIMGTTLIVVATRARTASRSFMAASTQPEISTTIPRAMLDEALFLLIRGSKDTAISANLTESLLKDMYEIDANKVPFRTEPWDAFGTTDPYLTEITGNGTVNRPAYGGNRTIEVDNDGDGTSDGVWLSGLLSPLTGATGGNLTFRVSYLVLDLDGRINVNTHGGGNGTAAGPGLIDGSSLDCFAGNRWTVAQQGGTPTAPNRPNDLRQAPVLGQAIAGRGSSSPYTLRLDRDATKPATLTGTVPQNPFTVSELERVLRPFDRDWSTLPPRLAATLTNLDNTARRAVTTESWDVTFTVGGAAPAAGGNPSPKFDLNSIPQGSKQAFASALYTAINSLSGAGATAATAQWCANVAEFRDPNSTAQAINLPPAPGTYTGVKPTVLGGVGGAWNGGFESAGDLGGVPMGTQTQITDIINGDVAGPLVSLVEQCPFILDAVYVPSRFTATTNGDIASGLKLVVGSTNYPVREPGRVNANTCSDDVWTAVAGSAGPARPSRPMRSTWDIVRGTAFTGAGGFAAPDIRSFDRGLANRFASAATPRSHVFAIWITLEVKDSAVTAGSPTCHRLFAIVDRSIPVDYAMGENKNVRDTIRLKRFLN